MPLINFAQLNLSSLFAAAWRTIQVFLASKALREAFAVALEVIPLVEAEAKKHPEWTSRDKQLAAFDMIEAELAERGQVKARFVFVAIELALEHLGYFNGK